MNVIEDFAATLGGGKFPGSLVNLLWVKLLTELYQDNHGIVAPRLNANSALPKRSSIPKAGATDKQCLSLIHI